MNSFLLNGLLLSFLLYSNYAVAHFVQLISHCGYEKPPLFLDSDSRQHLIGFNISISNDSIRGVASLSATQLAIDMHNNAWSASVLSYDPAIPVSFSFSDTCLSGSHCYENRCEVNSEFCNANNNASISVIFCPQATESTETQQVAYTSVTALPAPHSLVMQSLHGRAPPLTSRVSILAIIIASSVGGGTLLLLIVLALVYRRKVRRRPPQSKERKQEMGQVNRSQSIRAASIPTSPSRTPRPSRSSSRSRQKDKDQLRLMISSPIYVDPYPSAREPVRPTHQRSSSLRSQRSQKSFQSSQGFKSPSSSSSRIPGSGPPVSPRYPPLGLPTSPRDFRPSVARQRSLPRLPSQSNGRREISPVGRAARTEEDLDELEYVSVWED